MSKFHDIAEQYRARIILTTNLLADGDDLNWWTNSPGYRPIDQAEIQVGDEGVAWAKGALRATVVVGIGRINLTVASSSPGAISQAAKYGARPLITIKTLSHELVGPFRRLIKEEQ